MSQRTNTDLGNFYMVSGSGGGGGRAGPSAVWLIIPDNHDYGLGEPIAAYFSEEKATEALALIEVAVDSLKKFKLVSLAVK